MFTAEVIIVVFGIVFGLAY